MAEQAWRGELDLQFEHHPVHRYYPGSCRLADGLLGFKGIAGFYVIDSGDGLVMLDAGHLLDVKRCFELTHGRGETDDITWTWIPERRILHTGDLFIWAVPNAGNPQKVQRYVGDWADSLERMVPLGAEILLPGHGLPILGADRVRRALDGTARYLRSIEEQSVAAMNRGLSLDQVLQAVTPPADLADEPYLQPVYDDPSFLVRMVWRRYGGWWDGEFDNVVPATKREQAAAWVELAGGIDRVVERALAASSDGDHAVACHLIEAVLHAAPGNDGVHEARAAIYRANAGTQVSSMARNILNHAALASDQGRRDLASDE